MNDLNEIQRWESKHQLMAVSSFNSHEILTEDDMVKCLRQETVLFFILAIVKAKFTHFGYVRRNKTDELLSIFADLLQIPVTSIRLSDEGKDGTCDIREFLLTISTSNDKEKEMVISTLNEASFLEQLNDKCKKDDIFSLPANEFNRLQNPLPDETKGI